MAARLLLLGGVQLQDAEGVPLLGRVAQRHRLAILAVLSAARGRPVPRDRLIALVWPDHPVEAARHLLAESLYVFRRELGGNTVASIRDELALDTDQLSCDVHDFERAVDVGDIERALALYAGPFMDRFSLGGSLEFERWMEEERSRLARMLAVKLEPYATRLEAESGPAEARDAWRRLYLLDPFRTHVALRLAAALEAAGERAAALHHLHEHEQLVGAELFSEQLKLFAEFRSAPSAGADMTRARAPEEDRFIQVRVSAASGVELFFQAFRPGVEHALEVRVGRAGAGWISPHPTTPESRFPAEELAHGETHTLTVVLSVPALLAAPLVGSVMLPQDGNSTVHRFHVYVPPWLSRVEGRIAVFHANRVLQTALIEGPVGDNAAGPIELTVEARVRVNLSELTGRTRFDAALILNHARDHTPATTISSDTFAVRLVSPEIVRLSDWFDRRLSEVAYDRAAFSALRSEATQSLLRDFAQVGVLLHQEIVPDGKGSAPLGGSGPIQVTSVHSDARLPLEFVYDRPAPDDDAPLCPGAERSLTTGSCGHCPVSERAKEFVCPLGFWGLNRVIERHIVRPEYERAPGTAGVEFRAEPVAGRDNLPVLGVAACGWADRVPRHATPCDLEEIRRILGHAAGTLPQPLRDWEALADAVRVRRPDTLVLVVHTDVVMGGIMQRAELGDGSWLKVAQITRSHVRASAAQLGPLVLLVGCETDAPKIDFMGFVARFRYCGAPIVVSTGSTLHASHAAAMVRAFLASLAALPRGGAKTLGSVMLDIRRALLAQGLVAVLTLHAYGDADWRLTLPPFTAA